MLAENVDCAWPGFKKKLARRKTALKSTLPAHNDGAGHRVSERIAGNSLRKALQFGPNTRNATAGATGLALNLPGSESLCYKLSTGRLLQLGGLSAALQMKLSQGGILRELSAIVRNHDFGRSLGIQIGNQPPPAGLSLNI
jgi:hypothetical protein